MGDQETIEDLKERFASQARLFEERLSAIEASRDAGGLQEASAGGDQPPTGFVGAGTSEQAAFAGGSSLAVGSREISSIESAIPKFGSSVEFPLWKRRFEGFALTNDCMQAFTSAIDIPVGDPSVICRLLDQGFSETSVKRARIAWTCLTESITHRELLSRVFDTNSRSAGWRMLCDWFLPKTPAEKSKWKRQFNELVMEKKEEPMRFFARVDKVVGVLGSLGVHMPVEDANLKIVEVLTDEYEFEQRTILYKDNITRAEIEAIVRQRYTIMSRGASTRVRNVGQALVANKPDDRIRKQKDSDKGKPGKTFPVVLFQPRTTKAAVRRMGSTTT